MTAPAADRTLTTADATAAWRGVLKMSAAALGLSVLLLLALRTSTNPAPGSFTHDAVTWVQYVVTLVGSVLLALSIAMRQITRRQTREG